MHRRRAVQAAERVLEGGICDGLPGLEAADIAALLRDLPIPTPGDVPGMTVEEAVKV